MRKLLFIPVLVVALFLNAAGPVRATPVPVPGGTGTWGTACSPYACSSVTHIDGPNTITESSLTVVLHGYLEGVCATSFTRVRHADGSFNAHGVDVCSGSIDGRSGSWNDTVTNHLVPQPLSLQSNLVIHGTGGDLAQADGRYSLNPDGTTYTVWEIHFGQ